MGLLKHPTYWGRVINRIEGSMPMPGEVISTAMAKHILRLACLAFSDLVEDPEFEKDVAEAEQRGMKAAGSFPTADAEFREFLDTFRKAEARVLIQSGVSMDVTERILADIDDLLRAEDSIRDSERLGDKIRVMRTQCCRLVQEPASLDPVDGEFIADVKSAVTGVGIVGIDLGGIYVLPEMGDAIAGTSIAYGAAKCRKLLRRMW